MNKLVSEQLPNDGGYHVNRLVKEANDRLKQIGRQGKRATIKAVKGSLSLQFTFNDGEGRSQKNVGIGAISASANGILEAEKIAQLVTGQLVAGMFTWDWYNRTIGKDTSEQTKQLTCKEMVEQYKKHYFKQQKGNKTPENNWYKSCRQLERFAADCDKPLSKSLIREIVESTNDNSDTRQDLLNGLTNFLEFYEINDYTVTIHEYKKNNKIKRKQRNVPSSERIMKVYAEGFIPVRSIQHKWKHRYSQWQFLYGLLATYGLRIHEAWNIANWDKPVTLKNGDWVTVDINDQDSIDIERNAGDMVIPAILDPNNKEHILCIKHDTKTGYRMAMPISPKGHNWIEEFDLLQPLNLPDIIDPFKRTGKQGSSCKITYLTCQWFKKKGYGFTPHDLRHACTIRGHVRGYNPKALADSLGHSMKMSSTTYLRHMKDEVKYENLVNATTNARESYTELELLREENKALKAENQDLLKEIELLKMKLQLNETYRESKGQK